MVAGSFPKAIDSLREQMLPFFRDGDENSDYVLSRDYYEWYFSYARAVRPGRILEIGSRYGYSAIAMLLGHPRTREVHLVDSGFAGVPVTEAVRNVKRASDAATVVGYALDTRRIDTLPVRGPFDLLHVDGDHARRAARHDLELVLPHLSPRGAIILDDVDYARLGSVAARFKKAHGLTMVYVPTFRGHCLFRLG